MLPCEDEILNVTELTTKDLIDNYNCFIDAISVVVICLLLVVISISFYYYYTKHWLKQKHLLLFHSNSNKLKGIGIDSIL